MWKPGGKQTLFVTQSPLALVYICYRALLNFQSTSGRSKTKMTLCIDKNQKITVSEFEDEGFSSYETGNCVVSYITEEVFRSLSTVMLA